MNDSEPDVLIAGAGPAGLALACDLQRRRVSHRIISAADGGFEGSRAKGIQPRTMEVLDDLGVLAELEPQGMLYPKLGLHLGPFTFPKTMIKIHEKSEDVPHPNTLLAAQYQSDACLRSRLEQLGGRVDFATRLHSFTDGPDGITANIESPAGPATVRPRFLVGADGGGSTVRHAAGISFDGTTDENDRMIVADLTLEGLSRTRWHVWPRNAGRFMALCPLPDGEKFQLMLKLKPDEETDLGRDAVDAMIKSFVGRAKLTVHEIHWASVWRPNIRLAGTYRRGNVFLVGDAAHVHPPTGAQGMNTGIQDSYNLGWKLGQVIAGAPDSLLDTYGAERQPVAARVLGLSSEIYAKMGSQPLAGATRGDEERQLRLSYAGGPLAQDAGGATTMPVIRAGDRAPDALYTGADGIKGRIHEALRGPHFTLIAVGQPAIDGMVAIPRPRQGAWLTCVAVPEASPGLKRFYGIRGPTQILVRPDGYVAYTTQQDWAESFAKYAGAMLPTPDVA